MLFISIIINNYQMCLERPGGAVRRAWIKSRALLGAAGSDPDSVLLVKK